MTGARGSRSAPVSVAARPVVPAREHSADPDQDRTVHLVLLLGKGDRRRETPLCGARMHPRRMRVMPAEEPSCPLCALVHALGHAPRGSRTTRRRESGTRVAHERLAAVAEYRKLGWPLQLRPDSVALHLDPLDAVAMIIPTRLAGPTIRLLAERRCAPVALAHPALPGHQILLASERSQLPLRWPATVHRLPGAVPLPPTSTTYGPVRWIRRPETSGLRLCRAFDILAALAAAAGKGRPPGQADTNDATMTHPPSRSGRSHQPPPGTVKHSLPVGACVPPQ